MISLSITAPAMEGECDKFPCIGFPSDGQWTLALQDHPIRIDGWELQSAEVARDSLVGSLCEEVHTSCYGVHCIGKVMGVGIEWGMEVNKLNICTLSHLLNGLLYLQLPVSCTRLKARMLHTNRCRTSNEDTYLRIDRA